MRTTSYAPRVISAELRAGTARLLAAESLEERKARMVREALAKLRAQGHIK